MEPYQQWRARVLPFMYKLYPEPNGVDLHESYKRYAEGRREVLREEQADVEEILAEIFG